MREASGNTLTISNDVVTVSCDPASGSFRAESNGRAFLKSAPVGGDSIRARVAQVKDRMGNGSAIEIGDASGRTDTLTLYDGVPFLCIRVAVRNLDEQPRDMANVFLESRKGQPLSRADIKLPTFCVEPGGPAASLRTLGADGLKPADDPGERTCFAYCAVANPATRESVVCGWLTHDRSTGIIAVSGEGGSVRITPRSEYGRLTIPPGATEVGETLAVGFFEDGLDGLETYADTIARIHDVRLPKAPSGYCTWYHADSAGDQDMIAELVEWCGRNLRDYGLDFLQIDDGWQVSWRGEIDPGYIRFAVTADFSRHDPAGPYSRGMKPTADTIRENGLTAGIWVFPCGWDPKAPALADHPDWFARGDDGAIIQTRWTGHNLDMTHPEARDFLRGVVRRISKEWGYKYFKFDGMPSPMGADTLDSLIYRSADDKDHRDDKFGDAALHDPASTQIEAHRAGLALLREAAGCDAFLLGCTMSQNMRTMGASFGLLDGMRVASDTAASWDRIVPGFDVAARVYFLNGRVWYNDADCMLVREPLTLDQARAAASWFGISGTMTVVSEWLPGLPEERLEIVKRVIPNHNRLSRPVDVLERDEPRIWHLAVGEGEARRDVVAFFNWQDAPDRITLDLARLGLEPDAGYVGFDFWENEFVGPFTSELSVELRATSCRVIALRRDAGRPLLVSTSRHVTQGVVDVFDECWDETALTLNGRSRVVGGDGYELRVFTPGGPERWRVVSVEMSADDRAAGGDVCFEQNGQEVRVRVDAGETRDVGWRIMFANDGR